MSQPNQPYQPFQPKPWPPAPQQHSTVPPVPVSPPPYQPEFGTSGSEPSPFVGNTPPPPPRKKRHRVRNTLLTFAGVLILIITLAGIFGGGGDSSTPRSAVAPVTTTAPAVQATTAAAKPPAAAPTKAAPKPAPVVYKKITDREWKLIAKNPDTYAGKTYVVYGEVTQFDAATGDDAFLADVGGAQRKPSYGYVDYPTNTMLSGDAAKLAKLVEGDLFRAEVTVGGSMSYDTQIGGNTTVPMLIISSIKVTGSTAS